MIYMMSSIAPLMLDLKSCIPGRFVKNVAGLYAAYWLLLLATAVDPFIIVEPCWENVPAPSAAY